MQLPSLPRFVMWNLKHSMKSRPDQLMVCTCRTFLTKNFPWRTNILWLNDQLVCAQPGELLVSLTDFLCAVVILIHRGVGSLYSSRASPGSFCAVCLPILIVIRGRVLCVELCALLIWQMRMPQRPQEVVEFLTPSPGNRFTWQPSTTPLRDSSCLALHPPSIIEM